MNVQPDGEENILTNRLGKVKKAVRSNSVGNETDRHSEFLSKLSVQKPTIINRHEGSFCNTSGNSTTGNATIDNTFTPRKSLSRSPPIEQLTKTFTKGNFTSDRVLRSNQEKDLENYTKRQRSENESPESLNANKKQCGRFDNNNDNTMTCNDESSDLGCNSEKFICDTFTALDTIHMCKCENTARKDKTQTSLRDATNKMYKYVTLLIHKIGKLEYEKLSLETKLKDSRGNERSSRPDVNPNTEKRVKQIQSMKLTYADVTQSPQHKKTPDTHEIKQWTTPPANNKYETKIMVDQITDPQEVMQRLKEVISTASVYGGFKSIRHLRSGSVIVESHNQGQQQKLNSILENKDNIHVKELQRLDPMFMITGITKGPSETEFIQDLLRLNSEINDEIEENETAKIKLVAKKQCRNPIKENWILQAPAPVAKWFLKKETINFDLVRLYVREHLNLAICFRCSNFGHVAKYCTSKVCCYKCGAEHEARNCPEGVWKCPNCTKMKFKEEQCNHSARDLDCPVYKRKLQQFRNQINYGGPFLENHLENVSTTH